MSKIFQSLLTKLILSFLLFIVVITLGSFLFTVNQSKKALLDSTRDDLLSTISLVSTQISQPDIDTLLQFNAGDENTPQYLEIKNKLVNMRSLSPNLINFYVMRIEGKTITFLLDDTDNGSASIGQIYRDPEKRLFDAVLHPAVSDNFYTDEWGTFLSAYAPLRTLGNDSAVVIGVDMEAAMVIDRQHFIGNTIHYVLAGAFLIAALLIGLFSLTIIRDIRKLNTTAMEISKGNTNVRVSVKRKDEIGELAESFGRMVASLKIMLAEATEKGDSRDEK
jgi:HAMP domain-containing protein